MSWQLTNLCIFLRAGFVENLVDKSVTDTHLLLIIFAKIPGSTRSENIFGPSVKITLGTPGWGSLA